MKNSQPLPSILTSSEQGASMLELAIVIPVLLLLLMGVTQLGLIFSQQQWYSTLNYHTTITGAMSDSSNGELLMADTWSKLLAAQTEGGNIHLESITEPAETYDTGSRHVTVSSSLTAKSIFNFLNLDRESTITYTAPALYSNPSMAGLDVFANSRNGCYTCNLATGGGCSDIPCEDAPPPYVPPGTGGGCGCFSGDTPVTMADGTQKRIKSIKVGESVLSYDLESAQKVPAQVVRTFRRQALNYIVINHSLVVTTEHPFFVAGEWKSARLLNKDDVLLSALGQPVKIQSLERIIKKLPVYNLNVEPSRNYYAGGILVHNSSGPGCSGTIGTVIVGKETGFTE